MLNGTPLGSSDSKFRNMTGKLGSQNKWMMGAKVGTTTGCARLIEANGSLVAYPAPASADGRLTFVQNKPGRIPETQPVLLAHKEALTDFACDPFDDNRWATAARDCLVKTWRVRGKGTGFETVARQEALLNHGVRVLGLGFHPHVDGLLVTRAEDRLLRFWDLAVQGDGGGGGEPADGVHRPEAIAVLTLEEADVMPLDFAFDALDGRRLVVPCDDLAMRLYDVRASGAPAAVVAGAAATAKGFVARFLEGRNAVLSVGFAQDGARQALFWDQRRLDRAVKTLTIDRLAPPPVPFYDEGTGLLWFGGRGSVVPYVETSGIAPYVLRTGKISTGGTTLEGMCMLPKTFCDVRSCEVARFVCMTHTPGSALGAVAPLSFAVPRKDRHLFQEDLFPPVPGQEPVVDAAQFFSADGPEDTRPTLVSLNPGGMVSVYDVAEADGGRSREAEMERALALTAVEFEDRGTETLTEGAVRMMSVGWLYTSYVPRFLAMKGLMLYVFESADAAASLMRAYGPNIGEVRADPDAPTRFVVDVGAGAPWHFEAESEARRDQWVTSIQRFAARCRKRVEAAPASVPSPAAVPRQPHAASESSPGLLRRSTPLGSSSTGSTGAGAEGAEGTEEGEGEVPSTVIWDMRGVLTVQVPSLFRSTRRRCFLVKDGVMYAQDLARFSDEPTGTPVEQCHLDRIMGIVALQPASTDSPAVKSLYGFQVMTPNFVFNLYAQTEAQRQEWVDTLNRLRLRAAASATPETARRLGRSTGPLARSSTTNGGSNEEAEEDDEYPPEPEEDTEERAEGTLQLFWGRGVLGYWTGAYLSVYADEMFFFKSKTAPSPYYRVPLKTVARFAAVEGDAQATDFNALRADGSVVVYLRANDHKERARWLDVLEAKRTLSLDVCAQLGIDTAVPAPQPPGPRPLRQSEPGGESDGDSSGSGGECNVVDVSDLDNGRYPMLLHVFGKRKVRAWATEISTRSLNPHNALVLDCGLDVFVWQGAKASRVCKAKATDLAQRIRKERGARPTVHIIEQSVSTADSKSSQSKGKSSEGDIKNESGFSVSKDAVKRFWTVLGGSEADVAAAEACATPAEQDQVRHEVTVYRVRAEERKFARMVTVVYQHADTVLPSRTLLHCNNAYVVDCGEEVYAWLGKTASTAQRNRAVQVARALLGTGGRAAWTKVVKVQQGGEPTAMKEKFCDFPGMLPIHTGRSSVGGNVAAGRAQKPCEELAAEMVSEETHQQQMRLQSARAVNDDGSGVLRVWKIEGYEKAPYPADMSSQLFSGESYVMMYTYIVKNTPMNIIYFWQGRDSSVNEKGTSAYLTAEQAKELGAESSTQVRLVQHKETEHFLTIFRAHALPFVIHRGKLAAHDPRAPTMYDTRGCTAPWVKTVEVDLDPARLNTLHASVVVAPGTVYVWLGAHSLPDERAGARSAAELFAKQQKQGDDGDGQECEECRVVEVNEGAEPAAFWAVFGGAEGVVPARPPAMPVVPETRYPLPVCAYAPLLFLFNGGSGAVEVCEEWRPCEDDLVARVVGVVDAWTAVWVWIGSRTTSDEKRTALTTVGHYLRATAAVRGGDSSEVPVYCVQQFHEPEQFHWLFHAWDRTKERLPRGETADVRAPQSLDALLAVYSRTVYSYDELLADPLPEGVDSTRLETYLSDEEFFQLFKMTQDDFAKLKKWNQEQLKKDLQLY